MAELRDRRAVREAAALFFGVRGQDVAGVTRSHWQFAVPFRGSGPAQAVGAPQARHAAASRFAAPADRIGGKPESAILERAAMSAWARSSLPAAAVAFAREAFYPPLFPAVLALSGAAHHIAWAHALTALLLAASLPFVYLLGVRWLDDRRAAAVAVLCVALLPSLWVNAKGILSEPLFCLLLLATFCVLESGDRLRGRLWMLALLMAAMASTRSAALPVIAVYALWVVTRRGVAPAARLRELAPALAAFVAYGLWILLRPSATEDNYARIALANIGAFFGSPFAAAAASLLRQANAMAEGWIGSLLLYWVEGRPVR